MTNKKELKESYKQLKPKMGVFQIRNIQSNDCYIDSSLDLNAIWNRHRFQLNHGSHPNIRLQHDWKQLGEENFIYEILGEIKVDETQTIDYTKEVKVLKEMYIEELKPGY